MRIVSRDYITHVGTDVTPGTWIDTGRLADLGDVTAMFDAHHDQDVTVTIALKDMAWRTDELPGDVEQYETTYYDRLLDYNGRIRRVAPCPTGALNVDLEFGGPVRIDSPGQPAFGCVFRLDVR